MTTVTTYAVLTTASSVTCGHSGQVDISSAAKLKVNQKSVLLESSISEKILKTVCVTVPKTDNFGKVTDIKCTKVSEITGGKANKLKVDGEPVMLMTLKGKTNGMVNSSTPQDLTADPADQTKLKTLQRNSA